MPQLRVDGAEIYYEVHGSGPPMILISGTACDGAFWKSFQVPDFSRDHTVVTFDQRGIGRTTMQGDDYSTTTLAADVAALSAHLKLAPAIVVGHSMGGRVAQWVVLNHPETTKALVLASSGASYKTKGGIPPRICAGLVNLGYERYIREHNINIGFSKEFARANPDRVKVLTDNLLNALPSIEVYLAHVNARQLHDTADRLKDIRVPCLVMVGDDEVHGLSDTTHVQSAEVLANAIPNAKFTVIRGGGHFNMFSHPEEFNEAIRDFIRDVP